MIVFDMSPHGLKTRATTGVLGFGALHWAVAWMLVVWLAVSCSAPVTRAQPIPATKPSTHPAEPIRVEIFVDTAGAPELKDFGRQVGTVAAKWYPIICEALPSEGYTPPTRVLIAFRNDVHGAVAATRGNVVACSAQWFAQHPEDIGAIVHELVHVVQHYPKNDPVWLVEGIADYVRFGMYEPHKPMRFNVDRMKYTDGYQPAAAFLLWTSHHYDPQLVRTLNAALRENRYSDDLFRQYTGKPLDELWAQFKADAQRARDAARRKRAA